MFLSHYEIDHSCLVLLALQIPKQKEDKLSQPNPTQHQLNLTQVAVRQNYQTLPTPPTSQTTQASYLGD